MSAGPGTPLGQRFLALYKRILALCKRRLTGLIALALFSGSFLTVFLHAPSIGYTRDEGFYFSAAEHYADWFRLLAERPAEAFGDAATWRYYERNREHPALVKNLMALSFLAFAADEPRTRSEWPISDPGTFGRAMRLPSQLLSALAVALTFLLGTAVRSRRAGLVAALLFWLAPRHFFHAHLACFDMPIVALWLGTVLAYRRAQSSIAWAVLTGLIFGLALSTKHNAFFLPLVLGLHWLLTVRPGFRADRLGFALPRVPWVFVSMLVLGPAVLFAHWPVLWHHTLERLSWYFGFHLYHVNYPWEYFGTLLTDPPFPWLYPFAVTALTLPLPTLLLATAGFGDQIVRLVRHIVRRLTPARAKAPSPATDENSSCPATILECSRSDSHLASSDAWLLGLNAFIPMFIIALPSVPIFGGVKHWMHGMPFLCVLGAALFDRLLSDLPRPLWPGARTAVFAVCVGLVVLPSVLGAIRIGSFGTSFYNELAGSVRGAADLGMQRQYWSNNVTGVFPILNGLPRGARVFLHEVTWESAYTYQRDGLLRPDLQFAWGLEAADFVAIQYHREFVDLEYAVWQKTGHKKILGGLYLEEVPIVLVYDLRR